MSAASNVLERRGGALECGMPIHRMVLFAAALAAPPVARAAEIPPDLVTRAEASGFRATSSYDETLALLHRLEARSPYVKLGSFGTSEQGRSLPLVIVSKEKAFTAAEARRLPKPIVLLQSGIHAGEIDGKDASLMLLRELVTGARPEILDRITLLLAPIYNVDGHERVSRFNRSQQDGPEEGQGFRTNARGLDLNRDHLKLDSAEARALVSLVNAWRPHLHVDNHVSDGFDHAWELGFATAEAPQAAPSVDAWARATLPAAAEATRAAGHPLGPYLELLSSDDPAKGAITPPYRPRYSTGYFALRNRPSILIETHSHKPYRTRVLANHAWMVALLARGRARHPKPLVEAVAAAERRTVAMGAPDAAPSDAVLRLGPDRDDPDAGGGVPTACASRLRVVDAPPPSSPGRRSRPTSAESCGRPTCPGTTRPRGPRRSASARVRRAARLAPDRGPGARARVACGDAAGRRRAEVETIRVSDPSSRARPTRARRW